MESNHLNSRPNEDAVAELLTLNCEIDADGDKFYKNKEGQLHRIHGPAIIYNDGSEVWYKNGKCHREDGPAVIFPNGTFSHYINGAYHNKEQFIQWQKDNGIKPVE